MAELTYWYVTYSWDGPKGSGEGACVVDTSQEWFPIRTVGKFITDNTECRTVIVNGWHKLTKEQLDEYRGTE